jgi:hypothetical protein
MTLRTYVQLLSYCGAGTPAGLCGDERAADDDDARHGDDGQGVGGGGVSGTGECEGAFEPAFEVKVIKDRDKH